MRDSNLGIALREKTREPKPLKEWKNWMEGDWNTEIKKKEKRTSQ